MLKKLTNNLGLKVVSLLITIVLWIIAININDPVSQVSYTVPVVIENQYENKYMEVVDGSDQVKVSVRAKRSVLASFSDKNILATADFEKMTEGGYIPIELATQKTNVRVDSLKSDEGYVHVNVEDIIENTHFISSEIIGQTAEGYVVANTSIAKSRARIEGPESIVKKIKTVKAYIDVDGVSADVNDSAQLVLLDADGNAVEDERVMVNPSEISTTATIYFTKEIPVRYETTGSLPEGFVQDGELEHNVDFVFVQGKPGVVKAIGEIVIPDTFDLTEMTKTETTVVELKKYLPEGVSFVDSTYNGKTNVTIHIAELVSDEEDVNQEEE